MSNFRDFLIFVLDAKVDEIDEKISELNQSQQEELCWLYKEHDVEDNKYVD